METKSANFWRGSLFASLFVRKSGAATFIFINTIEIESKPMDIKFLTGALEQGSVREKPDVGSTILPNPVSDLEYTVRFTHSFFTVENGIVTDFDFTHLNVDETPASAIFRVSRTKTNLHLSK